MFSKSNYIANTPEKQAVVDRYNKIYYSKVEGSPVDFAEIISELIEAYVKAEKQQHIYDKWKCPIGRKDCTSNCGSYGCGN